MTAIATSPSQLPVIDDAPKKPLYHGSTQYRNWRFSPQQLAETRRSMSEAAVAAIKNTFEADEPGSSSDIQFVSAEEEHLLVKLYIAKIAHFCGHFRFNEEVEATAVSYLKRFYLKNTVMDWHPKNVMLTALFLATKTTNNPISLEHYTGNIPRTAPSDVLDLEFLVAQSLGFEFAIWHTHRALWGIWLDIQTLPEPPSKEVLQEAYDIATRHVKTSRLTDAELIYTPSQIALACMSLAQPDLATSWARAKDALLSLDVVESIKNMILRDGDVPSVEVVREIDRRLRLCKNPEKIVGSKAYLKKQAKEEQAASEKREKKAEVVRKAAEADPFGDALAEDVERVAELDDDD
ncbi:cyclin-like protein [Stereum hirsutum FP-91666 SS1]|uniref:cyclin-like protein n=1 Tax=Stereum hirsutum (strain FP-91666) TaxID=721885 RepID=UPI000440A1BE|nr:cyclin-like protein [Stereum hirsutum FP-91666 SS1]EIM92646.1 cyclin-like protein [Stereum hirsutum FP-91666 SS1]